LNTNVISTLNELSVLSQFRGHVAPYCSHSLYEDKGTIFLHWKGLLAQTFPEEIWYPCYRSILKYYGALDPDRLRFLSLSILWAEGYPGNSSNPNVTIWSIISPQDPPPFEPLQKVVLQPKHRFPLIVETVRGN